MPEPTQPEPTQGAFDPADPACYPIRVRDTARWGDTDRFGHINNAVFVTFLESGRISFLLDPADPLIPPGRSFVIARLTMDFRAEMHWFGPVEIGTAVRAVGRSSFTLAQAIFQDGGCSATADAVLVLIDEATRKSTPLPERMRERLAAHALSGG